MKRQILITAALAGAACAGPLGAPATIATGGVSNPTVARSGDALVIAWVGVDGNVYVSQRKGDSAATKAVRANDVAGEAAPHEQAPAQVAVAPDGRIYVIWQTRIPLAGRRFPASDLRIARSTDGGATFEPSLTINDDKGGPPSSHTFHDLMVDVQGTVFASWIDGRESEEGGEPQIRVARSTDGGRTFSKSVVVDQDACPCCRTSLARARDGTLYIAWRKVFAGDVRDVVVARSTDGGLSFEPPVRVHADNWVYPGCPHAGPSLAVDSTGALHVVWYTGAEGHQGLYLAISHDGGKNFGAPTALNAGSAFVPVSHARLASAGHGVWVAWEDRTVPGGRVALSRCGPDGKVAAAGRLAGLGRSPAIAGGPEGPAVAWLAGDSILVAAAP